ncbi:MAG: ribonuclease H-like domain-containing protein [Chthonomonadales bacterium]
MSADDLRKRLEDLNGGPLNFEPNDPARLDDPDIALRRKLTRPKVRSADRFRAAVATTPKSEFIGENGSLTQLLPGKVRVNDAGIYYHVRRNPVDLAPWFEPVGQKIAEQAADDRNYVFLDIETLGFQGEPVWLIGVLAADEDGNWWCEQLLARDLKEEAAMILGLKSFANAETSLVTFNGISFDWPMIADRGKRYEIEMPELTRHHDMLLIARAAYGRRVPNHKLQTLESVVLGRERVDDVPGHRIPAVYREFVKTGMAGELVEAVKHNVLDLVSTAELFTLTRRRGVR